MPFSRTGVSQHGQLGGTGVNDHHNEAHAPESHTGQGATGAELETLTDGSSADALHIHPALARVATGSYTGDGSTGQVISGLGMTPVFVKISARQTTDGGSATTAFTTNVIVDDIAAGASIIESTAVINDNEIIAMASGSFTVDDAGADGFPNTNGQVYNYLVIGS